MAEALLLALDLGTTTLQARLVTTAGEVLAEAGCDNPQRCFGDDVIRRLEASLAGDAIPLQKLLVKAVNELVAELLDATGTCLSQLTAAAAAANPAVSLLFAGQSVERVLFPPHRPEYKAGSYLDASSLGLDLPVPLYLFPLVSGYVGGDLVAVLFGADLPGDPVLYVDLGTNAELALWDGEQWLVTSVAAGPAFEAGPQSCGMRYDTGAVQRIRFHGDRLELDVVGGGAPIGLCGSGLMSAISGAVQSGLIDHHGRILNATEVDTPLSRYLVAAGEGVALQLYRDADRCLLMTQKDVRDIQLAKGAVAAGVTCLLDRSGLAAHELAGVWLAGAMGSALTSEDLKGVVMFPEIMLEKVRFLPSAVLDGVVALLTVPGGEERVRRLAARLKPFPLSGTPAFERNFLGSLDLLKIGAA